MSRIKPATKKEKKKKKDMAGAIKEQLDMEEDFNQLPGKGPWHVVR